MGQGERAACSVCINFVQSRSHHIRAKQDLPVARGLAANHTSTKFAPVYHFGTASPRPNRRSFSALTMKRREGGTAATRSMIPIMIENPSTALGSI